MQIENFGFYLKRLREERSLPLRKVSAALDIDTSTLSKIERGNRSASRDIAQKAAKFFEVDEEVLIILLVSDKVAYDLLREEKSDEILKVADKKIKYLRSKNSKQGSIKF